MKTPTHEMINHILHTLMMIGAIILSLIGNTDFAIVMLLLVLATKI